MTLSQLNSNKFDGFSLGNGGNGDIQISNARQETILVAQDGTGDYDNIQDAINELKTGSRIFIKEGTYDIKNRILIHKSNIKIEGSGYNTFIRSYEPDLIGEFVPIFEIGDGITTRSNIEISGMKIRTHDNTEGISYCAFRIQKCTNSIIRNNFFVKETGSGYPFTTDGNCSDILITNNFSDSDSLINAISGTRISILNNLFSGGMILSTLTKSIISGNKFGDSMNTDVLNMISSDNNSITGNIIKSGGGDAGIYMVSACNMNTITGNEIINNTGDGVIIEGNSNRNIINANIINGNSHFGVLVSGATDDLNLISNNVIFSNTSGTISDAGTGTVKVNNILT